MQTTLNFLALLSLLVALVPCAFSELPDEKDQTVYVPYWSLENGLESTIHLHNNLTSENLTVTPILFSYSGQTVELPTVHLSPLGNGSVELGANLVSRGWTGGKLGSAALRYRGRFQGALLAEISVVQRKKRLAYTVVGGHSGPKDAKQHAVFWLPGKTSEFYASLFNSSGEPVHVTPVLHVSGRNIALPVFVIPAKNTRLIELPQDLPEVWNFRETMLERGEAAGFTLQHNGARGALIASGWIEDEKTGFSTMVTFHDPVGAQDSRLLGGQILEGAQPELAPGRRLSIRSYLVLWNLTDRAAAMRGELAYTSGGQFVVQAFPPFSLRPWEVRLIEVGDLLPARPIPSELSLRLEHDAAPGGVMGRVFGISENKDYGFYWSLDSNAGATYNELFWSAEFGWNTILTVTNAGDKADDVTVTFTTNEGQFSLPSRKLAPLESYTVLAAHEVQTRGGGARSGGFRISGGSKQSRLLVKEHVVNIEMGISAPYYGTYNYVYYLGIWPSPMDLDETYTNGYFFDTTQYWSDGHSEADCGSVSSRNTSVVTASKSWLYCQNTATPVSQGTTYIDAQSEWVPINSAGTYGLLAQAAQVKVRRPHHVSYISTTNQGNANCPSGQAGWSRLVTLELRADDNLAYRQLGITMGDAITIQSTNQLGIGNTTTGSSSTNSQGRWPDSYFVCSTACPASTGRSDAIQSWTWNSNPLPQVNSIVYRCTSITFDGQ